MKRPHFAGLSCALIPLSTLLAADPSSPDIAGRIRDIHGAVSWRQGATGEPRRLDAARDRGRLLHRGEQLQLDQDSTLEIQISTDDTLIIEGPLPWTPLFWKKMQWQNEVFKDLTRHLLGGRVFKSGHQDESDEPESPLKNIAPYLNCQLSVDVSTIHEAGLLKEISDHAPFCATLMAGGATQEPGARPALSLSQTSGQGLLLKRADGSILTELQGENVGQRVAQALSREALWRTVHDLKNPAPDRAVRIELRLRSARTGSSASISDPKASKCFHDQEPVLAEVENTGGNLCRATLVSVSGDAEMTVFRENLALKPGEKESLDLLAQKSAASLPDLLLVIATSKPLGGEPLPATQWDAQCAEFCVTP